MKCIEISEPGGPDVLRLTERSVPEPGPEEVLIRLDYAGVNRPDILQRSGAYPPPPGASDLLGLEGAGVIEAMGRYCNNRSVGERVTALLPGGGYAEMAVTSWKHAIPVPDDVSLLDAAALPETFMTVIYHAEPPQFLRPYDCFWVLVHGGSSGIGTAAIQYCTAKGARVIVTAGSDEKCARCLELGAVRAINYHKEDFVLAVMEETCGVGAHCIVDMVGGSYMERNIRAAAVGGRIESIAFLEGSKIEVDFARAMVKRLTWSGATLRAAPEDIKWSLAERVKNGVMWRIQEKQITPVIDSVFPLEEAADAHRRMESSKHIGKIMLKIGG